MAKRKITVRVQDIYTDFYVRKSLEQERVLQLMMLYEAKEPILPILIAPGTKSAVEGHHQYILVDGRHRFAALTELGVKEIDAYVTEGDTSDLITEGFRANYGGSKPPTEADILHTLELLLGQDLTERQIMDRMPMPRPVTRRYLKTVESTLYRRKVQAAAVMVIDKGMTVKAAADEAGIDSAALRSLMGSKTKKQIAKGLDSFKGQLTNRFRSIANKNSHTLRKLLQGYEDGEVAERVVLATLAHFFKLLHQQEKFARDYANRFEIMKAQRSAPKTAKEPAKEQRASA